MTSKIERVRLDVLIVDGTVQRGLDLGRVKVMADAFNWDGFGTPTVSRRTDGSIRIVDGQHRVMAARRAGHGARSVQMRVHDGLTLQQEAELFRLLNDTRKPMPVDLFRVAVIEGEPAAVAMNDLVKRNGLYVAASGERSFRAVQALRSIYEVQPLAAERALATLVAAWGISANSVQASLVQGMGRFFLRYGEQPSVEKLIANLAKYAGGSAGFIGAARGLAQIKSMPVADAVADVAVGVYNKTARDNRLADWRRVR
jgi:hypothetical protein